MQIPNNDNQACIDQIAIDSLLSEDALERSYFLHDLSKISPNILDNISNDVILYVSEMAFLDKDPTIKEVAKKSITSIAMHSSKNINTIHYNTSSFLSHKDWEVREQAIEILGSLAAVCPIISHTILLQVQRMSKDSHKCVRFSAHRIMRIISDSHLPIRPDSNIVRFPNETHAHHL